jgi:hypothetical protein
VGIAKQSPVNGVLTASMHCSTTPNFCHYRIATPVVIIPVLGPSHAVGT